MIITQLQLTAHELSVQVRELAWLSWYTHTRMEIVSSS